MSGNLLKNSASGNSSPAWRESQEVTEETNEIPYCDKQSIIFISHAIKFILHLELAVWSMYLPDLAAMLGLTGTLSGVTAGLYCSLGGAALVGVILF